MKKHGNLNYNFMEEALRNEDFLKGEYYYSCFLANNEFCNKYLAKLIRLEILAGRYNIARLLINKNLNSNIYVTKTSALLDHIENNFTLSKKAYQICANDKKLQYKAQMSLSQLDIQLADDDLAKEKLFTLSENASFRKQALINLVCLYLLEKDYDKAFKYLNILKKENNLSYLKAHIDTLDLILNYKLGTMNKTIYARDNYLYELLYYQNNDYLIDHLARHFDPNHSFERFLPGLDLDWLVEISQEKISKLNPNHFEVSDMYRFHLESPVGLYQDGMLASDVCVVTLLGTKKIITIYPVCLSDEFDKEGILQSDELSLKRRKNIIG